MSSKKRSLRSSLALLATAGMTGALLASTPLAASASPTVIDYASTVRADYTTLTFTGGGGGVSWAPWAGDGPDAGLNAPWVTGSANWNGREGWAARNFVVQDDGSGNNALWVQKAKAGCPSSGVQVAKVANGSSLISSANKVITVKVKAADADVPVEATLTDAYGGNVLKVVGTAATADAYNTVSFDFAAATTGSYVSNFSYTTLSLVMDPANAIAGTGTDWAGCGDGANVSKAYILDDLTYSVITDAETPPGPDVPHKLTFETADTLGTQAAGSASGDKWAGTFGSGGSGIVTPTSSKKHTGKALEFNKAGGDLWTGLNLFKSPEGEVITSAQYKKISFDYYSPVSASTPVSIKLLVNDADHVRAAFKAKKGWQTFTIDVSTITGAGGTWSADKNYTQLVLYPQWADADIMPAGLANPTVLTGQKFMIDNVAFNGYALPTKVGTPAKSGTAKVGRELTASGVTLNGNRIVRSFKWYRCSVQGKSVKYSAPSSSDKCSTISGATAGTYTLVKADKGKYIRVAFVGTTAAGTYYAVSTSTSKVS